MKKTKILRIAIVAVAIIAVVYFAGSRWTHSRTAYGEYGNGNFVADKLEGVFYLPFSGGDFRNEKMSPFEKETIYREVIEYKYNLAFMKIFIFSGIVFMSAFLLLKICPDKK